jgi:glyoxalase/bleomycin resistance protein/dioxygenase superfamily protein
MRQIPIRFLCCLILYLAGYPSYLFLNPASVFGADTESPVNTAPKVDHILLEVSNLDAAIAFYRDILGLRLKSRSHDFVLWNLTTSESSFGAPDGIGKNRALAVSVKDLGCILILVSTTQRRSLREHGKRVIG